MAFGDLDLASIRKAAEDSGGSPRQLGCWVEGLVESVGDYWLATDKVTSSSSSRCRLALWQKWVIGDYHRQGLAARGIGFAQGLTAYLSLPPRLASSVETMSGHRRMPGSNGLTRGKKLTTARFHGRPSGMVRCLDWDNRVRPRRLGCTKVRTQPRRPVPLGSDDRSGISQNQRSTKCDAFLRGSRVAVYPNQR
jgi:hypothetical protein